MLSEADEVVSGWTTLQEFCRRRIDLAGAESASTAEKYSHRMLCRLEFLLSLARAASIAEDNGKYLSAIDGYLTEWDRVSEEGNRRDSVDESIRVLVLLEVLTLTGPDLGETGRRAALRSLASAGWTIQTNLTRTGNHRIYEGLALFCLGTCLSGHSRATRWQTMGQRILEREIRHQVLDDGMNAELSTNYHLITGTNFLKAWVLGKTTGNEFSDDFAQKLARMAVRADQLRARDGGFFALGDSDRMAGSSREEREGCAFAELGRLLKTGNRNPEIGVNLQLMLNGLSLEDLSEGFRPSSGGIYSCGGYWIATPADGGALLFDAGLFGLPGASHHAHADSLSFEIHLSDCRFLVDPGGFSYVDGEARAFARSTLAHNTVTIDECDSSDVSGAFNFGRGARVKLIEKKELPRGIVITAEHDGYTRLKNPVIHRRAMFLMTDGPFVLLVADRITGRGQHRIEVAFHADENWEAVIADSNHVVWRTDQRRLDQILIAEEPTDIEVFRGATEPKWQGWVCHRNGSYLPASVVTESIVRETPVDVVNVFFEAGDTASSADIKTSNNSLFINDNLKLYWKWVDDRLVVDIQ
jgi:hypothetical protein